MSRTRIHSEVDFTKDGKQSAFLRLPHSVHRSAYGWLPMPITCIKNGAGPRVLLVSGNHGDEYEGQVTLMKLTRRLQPDDIKGRVVILSAANVPAENAGRRTAPIDLGNLNRTFPGPRHGPRTLTTAPAPKTRLLRVGGADSYVYAPDSGLFEPHVDLGDTVTKGQSAGLIHFPDTPWREPTPVAFAHDGLVICKRIPGKSQ